VLVLYRIKGNNGWTERTAATNTGVTPKTWFYAEPTPLSAGATYEFKAILRLTKVTTVPGNPPQVTNDNLDYETDIKTKKF
jgi:hypothetical protein